MNSIQTNYDLMQFLAYFFPLHLVRRNQILFSGAHSCPSSWQLPEGVDARPLTGLVKPGEGLSATGGPASTDRGQRRGPLRQPPQAPTPFPPGLEPLSGQRPPEPGYWGSSDIPVERGSPSSLTPMPPISTTNMLPNSRAHDLPPTPRAEKT